MILVMTPAAAQQRGPASSPEPPVLFRAGGSIDLTYTDNAEVSPTNPDSDLITGATASAIVSGRGRRGEINAVANISYDYYTHNTRLSSERYDGLLNSRIDLIEDSLDLVALASTSLRPTTVAGAQPAGNRAIGANQTQVISYSASPRWRMRFGSQASAVLDYTFSGSAFAEPPNSSTAPPASDSSSHRVGLAITSGSAWERLRWTLSGSWDETRLSNRPVVPLPVGGRTSQRRNGEAVLEYRVRPALGLVATGGYDKIEEPTLTQRTDDPYGRAGVNWTPTTRTAVRVEGGYRFGGPTLLVDLSYAPREWFTLNLAFDEAIETQQRLLPGQIGELIRDADGNLIDPITGGPPAVDQIPFDLSDQAFRTNSLRAAVIGRVGRSTYVLNGAFQRRDANGLTSDQWTGALNFSRQLSLRATASLNAGYTTTEATSAAVAGQATDTIFGTARVDYQLGRTFFIVASYTYQSRETAGIETDENTVVLSFARRF